ncbi:hypothetical protein Ae201684P_015835 [Aphanomyces euteiches]|nr:hypothetical protein Ae201684P_015835 [Aphanomyces euteiches]
MYVMSYNVHRKNELGRPQFVLSFDKELAKWLLPVAMATAGNRALAKSVQTAADAAKPMTKVVMKVIVLNLADAVVVELCQTN